MIAQFNRTETQFPDSATLQELIEAQIDAHASHTAVICDHDKALGAASIPFFLLSYWLFDRLRDSFAEVV